MLRIGRRTGHCVVRGFRGSQVDDARELENQRTSNETGEMTS